MRKRVVNSEKVRVAYTIDKHAVMLCYVSIRSIVMHTSAHLSIYIVSDGQLSDQDRTALQELCSETVDIWFLTFDKNLFSVFPIGEQTGNVAVPLTTYFRLYFPVYFEFDKIIYVDADTMFTDDILWLWQQDLGDRLVAGVPDKREMQQKRKPALGLSADESYVNAGVLVMNLREMRQIDFFERCRQEIDRQREKIVYHDQDLLNLLCRGRILLLPYKWNLLADYLLREPREDSEKVRLLQDAQRHPGIIHFAGAIKPWQARCWHPYQRRWRKYLCGSPFPPYGEMLIDRLKCVARGYFYYFCLGPSPYARPRE